MRVEVRIEGHARNEVLESLMCRGDVVAVFYREHRLTYRRIWELVNRAANALRRGGVQRLDRVLLLLHDSPAFAAAFLGAIKLGAVPVPANTLLLPEDYEFMLRDSGARSLVVERGLLQKVRPALAKLRGGQGRWGDLETVYVAGQLPGSGTTVEYPGESERGNEPGYTLRAVQVGGLAPGVFLRPQARLKRCAQPLPLAQAHHERL